MTFQGWLLFLSFWVVMVASPGPNAVNAVQNGLSFGFGRAFWGVAGIMTQAVLFMALSVVGVAALLVAVPGAYALAQIVGALMLVGMGVRGWQKAARPLAALTGGAARPGAIYLRAFAIATINPKSVAAYLAAFAQFVDPARPLGPQLAVIAPTVLCVTVVTYSVYIALGVRLGRAALSTIADRRVRRGLAGCLVFYGVALGVSVWVG